MLILGTAHVVRIYPFFVFIQKTENLIENFSIFVFFDKLVLANAQTSSV